MEERGSVRWRWEEMAHVLRLIDVQKGKIVGILKIAASVLDFEIHVFPPQVAAKTKVPSG